MVCITGDTHGDFERFSHKNLKKLKKGDSLIICGDFGFLWDGSKAESKILKKIGKLKFNTLFIDGCHENFDLLKNYETTQWNGANVRVISGRLMYIERGSILNLDGKKFFAFGGGQSSDHDLRKEDETWWKEEIPTQEEMKSGIENLHDCDFKVDYIITHEPPQQVKDFLEFDILQKSELHTYFDVVKEKTKFKRWFFGKSHMNKVIPPLYVSVFNDVITLEN